LKKLFRSLPPILLQREKIEAIKRDEIARDTAREEEESVQQEGLERR
jgi:hypothetical protein